MPKLGAEPKRRAEVINATLTCISEYGIDSMTLDKVAEYAGCSKGVVIYYFKNKKNLIIEAFKSFLAFYGQKIQSEIQPKTMTAEEMIEITLKHILPPYDEGEQEKINVSELSEIERRTIPYQDQGRLFIQFYSKSMVDHDLQEILSTSYTADIHNIARIFEYGKSSGHMHVDDSNSAAYGLMAMVVGLGFFRAAHIATENNIDNRFIGENYIKPFIR